MDWTEEGGMNWFRGEGGGGFKMFGVFVRGGLRCGGWVAKLLGPGPGPDRFSCSRVMEVEPGDSSSRLFLVGFAFHVSAAWSWSWDDQDRVRLRAPDLIAAATDGGMMPHRRVSECECMGSGSNHAS